MDGLQCQESHVMHGNGPALMLPVFAGPCQLVVSRCTEPFCMRHICVFAVEAQANMCPLPLVSGRAKIT